MRVALAMVACAAGCGRSGFEPVVDAIPDSIGTGVVTLGETPGADVHGVTADTYLDSEVPHDADNYGASTTLSLEGSQKRALLRFDASALAGKTVVTAKLQLAVAYKETSGTATIVLAPVLESWTEGMQIGAPGAASFTQRMTATPWTTAGAGTPGSSGAQIATADIATIGPIVVDLPAAIVQAWIDQAPANFGIVLTSGGSELRLASSDATTATDRPALIVGVAP